MPSNFVDLNQAAQMLGVTPDELVEMRSQGEIFGFRDGSSWKFKMDELERVAAERGTQLGGDSAGSDPGLGDDSELDLSKPLFGSDSADLAPDEADASSIGDLMAVDDIDLDSDDEADSLLVSDETPLVSDSGGGSTIIGDSPSPESDLTLAPDDDADVLGSDMTLAGSEVGDGSSILGGDLDAASKEAGGSDVRLVAKDDGSDVTVVPDSDELLTGPDGSGIGANQGDSDDLEIGPDTGAGDLELSAGSGTGDLDLTADSSGGELELSAGSGTGDLELADDSGGDLELSVGSGTGDLELDLDSGNLELDDGLEDDDDLVLGDSSAGSDVTLGTGDTGINLTSPSDSGLSLEEEPIELGAAASSLELPEEDVIALEESADPDAATQLKQDEEFLLSPRDAIDDDDSGSQVIALEDSAAFDQDAATLLGTDAFADAGGLEQQVQQQQQPMEMAPAGDLLAAGGAAAAGAMAPMGAPGAEMMGGAPAPEAPREAPYSIWNVLSLMLITGVLSLSGMLMMDVVRNMWSWDGANAGVSTSIMDGLLSAFKIK